MSMTLAATTAIRAQTIRGTTVDESTRLPVGSVLVTLTGDGGAELSPGTRSDSLGRFVLHATRSGRYRIKAMRIGYQPVTSEPITLEVGELAVVHLRMTTVAQQLVPIRIVERRRLSVSELDSYLGFDLRQSKGVGRFMNADQLAEFGLEGAGEVFRSYLRTTAVSVVDGPNGPYLSCNTYLDGERLVGFRESRFARLDAIPAKDLYGIEVYRAGLAPPPSLGGSIAGPGCSVAVWTKNGKILASSTAPQGPGLSGIQVLRGVTQDFDAGRPVPGVRIRLIGLLDQVLADVRSDSIGQFTIRTRRAGELRLQASNVGSRSVTTPSFVVDPEELVVLKLFVSATQPVQAPLGIVTRMGPGSHAVTDVAAFAYRRERGVDGVFFGTEDIRRRNISSVADLIRGIEGVSISGTGPSEAIMMRTSPKSARMCRPALFMNGARAVVPIDSALKAIDSDRLFGVEVFPFASLVPLIHADGLNDCGMIGVWIR